MAAPSLIPKAPGDRVKTDRRDARRLARLHRAGELSPIRIPTPQEEAVRDLCRARADMVEDLDRARRRLGALLLRHGQVWRGGARWTLKHDAWLRSLRFDDRALASTFRLYLAVEEVRSAELRALEEELVPYCRCEPFASTVGRLIAYDGNHPDVFATKLDPFGSSLAYSTYLGGGQIESPTGLIPDGDGSLTVVGDTLSSDFPTTPHAFDRSRGGPGDAFVSRFNPSGRALVYSSFLGGTGNGSDIAYAVADAGLASVFVAGETPAHDFPVTPDAYDTTYNGGGDDAFVVILRVAR